MNLLRVLAVNAVALLLSISNGYAGPCSSGIAQTQQNIDAKLQAREAKGASAGESTSATLHRQPTPQSIATAEEALGGLSAEKVQLVEKAMARARAADESGDEKACSEALAEVQRAIGP
jgi:hypothetical protein